MSAPTAPALLGDVAECLVEFDRCDELFTIGRRVMTVDERRALDRLRNDMLARVGEDQIGERFTPVVLTGTGRLVMGR